MRPMSVISVVRAMRGPSLIGRPGATVSQLDDDQVFYLQSRGLNQEASRNLLIDAFAAEILNKLPLASLQHILKQCVACKI